MKKIITFGGIRIDSTKETDIETQFGIKLTQDRDEKIPLVFPNINQSSCSCDKCIKMTSIDNFKITATNETQICIICR